MENLADAAIETLDHAVGLRVARRAQAVLDSKRLAAHIEFVAPARLSLLTGEPVRELTAVVREQFDDLHGGCPLKSIEEVHAAVLALIGVDVHEHPACGAVNGHEQIAPLALVGHLREVLDVHMQEARLVVLEGL